MIETFAGQSPSYFATKRYDPGAMFVKPKVPSAALVVVVVTSL